jgi:hypothetical protein
MQGSGVRAAMDRTALLRANAPGYAAVALATSPGSSRPTSGRRSAAPTTCRADPVSAPRSSTAARLALLRGDALAPGAAPAVRPRRDPGGRHPGGARGALRRGGSCRRGPLHCRPGQPEPRAAVRLGVGSSVSITGRDNGPRSLGARPILRGERSARCGAGGRCRCYASCPRSLRMTARAIPASVARAMTETRASRKTLQLSALRSSMSANRKWGCQEMEVYSAAFGRPGPPGGTGGRGGV